ncbi:MAG: adenylyltransferase/cytidyltransferase family protein [Candidatus Anammoxibacter sp.]
MEDKIIRDIDRLVRITNKLKAEGNKIVFGNGCFDILHVGHIRYLKGAKELGDCLIIAVNSDSSARTIKRSDGLIIPEDERLEMLAAIEHIDYVTLFTEPTVENLLLKLKPHIHAKGTDYTKETVPEKDTVASYGGRVEIVGDKKNHSSTEIKSSIRNRS